MEFEFDEDEIKEIAISVIVLSLAFSIVLSGGLTKFLVNNNIFFMFFASLLTVGIGFILHELMHKFVAQMYNSSARYVMWAPGLGMALLFSIFFKMILAAPGAVYIYAPYLTREEYGKISLAGPAMNVLISLGFLFLLFIMPSAGLIKEVLYLGAYINVFLAGFNMIPFPPLDGSKVFNWNPVVWAVFVAAVGFLYFFVL